MFYLVYRNKSGLIEGSEYETRPPLKINTKTLKRAINHARKWANLDKMYCQDVDKQSMRIWYGSNVYAVFGDIDRFSKQGK